MNLRKKWGQMNPYDIHKMFINEYMLTRSGTTKLLQRDASRDKSDIDVIRENHQFLWNELEYANSWEKKVAKKYYDRLFKEYCIADLTLYRQNKFGLRWRTEKELIDGKGQFSCGARKCGSKEGLKTWEVKFEYVEHGVQKTALVKLRLCPMCSKKLNYRFKRKEVKRLKETIVHSMASAGMSSQSATAAEAIGSADSVTPANTWQTTHEIATKTENQQVDEFLQNLFL